MYKNNRAAWTNGGEDDVLKKFEKYSKDLEWWDKNCFGVVRCELEERKKMLAKVEAEAMNSGNNFRARELKSEVNILLDREIWSWRKRSRVLWLNKGDSNSTFFHSKATHRFRKNIILGIRDKGELWQEQVDLIEDL